MNRKMTKNKYLLKMETQKITGVYRFWLCITFGESESKQWKVLRFPDQNLKTEYFCETITNKKLGV
jgi:hypothetical protein